MGAWSEETWIIITAVAAVAAVAVALFVPGLGALASGRRRRKEQEPHLVFGSMDFLGPGQHVRPAYECAAMFHIRNAGPGTAFHVAINLVDERQDIFSEVYEAPTLAPNEGFYEGLGIRGEQQGDDPGEAACRAFFDRCYLVAVCWDRLGRAYLFTPAGGGLLPLRHRILRKLPWRSGQQLHRELSAYPSRGEERRGTGMGPPPEN